MTTGAELFRPWMIAGSVFSKMLQRSPRSNNWLENTLNECLPIEILQEWQDRLVLRVRKRGTHFG